MSDSDAGTTAWRVPPSRYLADRPVPYARPARPRSLYLTMRDGCRLAADIYLPQPAGREEQVYPTILILTPYYRRFALREGAAASSDPSPNAAKYRDFFVQRGYAVVVVDVRGTGASFGTRDSFRSPKERDDSREIADWIVAQPWSDGIIGSTGISYLGAASCFLASTGHPAVKAIAPLFAVWNTYVDHFYPGGVLLNQLAKSYDDIMVGLDHDRRDILARQPYFDNPDFVGPQPVDEDGDGALCRAAVREHLGNFHMPDFISEFRFTDDRLPYDPSFGAHSFSPCHYAGGFERDCAILSVSGWMDGAGFSNGAIARYLSLPKNRQHMLIGPWDHGARTNVSPWRGAVVPDFDVLAEVLRFFDHYLMGHETGLGEEAPIHYFCMHEERWHAASAWPPRTGTKTLTLAANERLQEAPSDAGTDLVAADFTAGTGSSTRHERLAAVNTTDYYGDWADHEAAMASYDSDPLPRTAEITGHPVVDIWLTANQPDAVLHVYLSEVESDGRIRYVTEGVLRALHRHTKEPPENQRWTWPFRDFSRADAEPLPSGEPARLRFALLPVSWRFQKGSRIRLSIAAADADHYVQLPHGRPPVLAIHRGGDIASTLQLPWHEGSQSSPSQEREMP
ncbi:CocE/NonD family hydrolase [Aurantimonas sp. VKM B-3413]|uniref:CocE/NonD family hydrolase n=1 Tax=Aurantimonas sp. VKM B-3413 TaxID=2779401 RepID=UPI001E31497C|nr:CocE/NonD family hydrolase [Aurantimonas sp. VKM B-3413]MCB8836110.1 CocE/NonD family hydrolase [Aurantimonas sp. VKM B-3413]